jgi:hypothetical protein
MPQRLSKCKRGLQNKSTIAGLFVSSTLAIVSIFQPDKTSLCHCKDSRRYLELVFLSVKAKLKA